MEDEHHQHHRDLVPRRQGGQREAERIRYGGVVHSGVNSHDLTFSPSEMAYLRKLQ